MTWPPASQLTESSARPLCAVKIVVSCHPPITALEKPPRLRNCLPRPKGSSYRADVTRRKGVLKPEGPYSHWIIQYGFSGYWSPVLPRIALPLSRAFDQVKDIRVVRPDLYRCDIFAANEL